MSRTEVPCHGGRAFNGFHLKKESPLGTAEALAIFANSTLGAIARIGYGNASQEGRSCLSATSFPKVPYPNFAGNTSEATTAREIATRVFPRLSRLELEPFAFCYRDPARHEIDLVCAKMLGLPDSAGTRKLLQAYREAFANEPRGAWSAEADQKGFG